MTNFICQKKFGRVKGANYNGIDVAYTPLKRSLDLTSWPNTLELLRECKFQLELHNTERPKYTGVNSFFVIL